jgi:hypothetical protein
MLTVTTKTSLNAKGIIFAIRVGLEITSVRHRPIPDVGCGGPDWSQSRGAKRAERNRASARRMDLAYATTCFFVYRSCAEENEVNRSDSIARKQAFIPDLSTP